MVHSLPKGVHLAPMPPLYYIKGSGRTLQGGLAPVPFRSCTHKWGSGNQQTSPAKVAPKGWQYRDTLRGYDTYMAHP